MVLSAGLNMRIGDVVQTYGLIVGSIDSYLWFPSLYSASTTALSCPIVCLPERWTVLIDR